MARSGREDDANRLERGARDLSNWADSQGIGPGARDLVHGVWHAGAGVVHALAAGASFVGAGMMEDDEDFRIGMRGGSDQLDQAGKEFDRAGKQFSKGNID